jgi:sarcosine oxidase subunit gamma
VAEIKTISPGYNRVRLDSDTSLMELPWCGKINLRGDPQNSRFANKVETGLGLDLPLEPNSCNKNETETIYWLGPDEWLVHCELSGTQSRIAQLKTALAGVHSAVVDLSDYYTVLRLDGPDSTRLLSKACPMDLHPDVFVKGACSQTRFGSASILLHKTSKTPTYDIQVRWSFTEYVWDYLVSGMAAL